MSTATQQAQEQVTLADVCAGVELGIDIKDVLPLVIMKSAFGGGEGGPSLDALLQVVIAQRLKKAMLAKITVPAEYRDIAEAFCYAMAADDIKMVTAALKGEAPQVDIGATLEKLLNIMLTLKLLAKFTK